MPNGLSKLVCSTSTVPRMPSSPGKRNFHVHCWDSTSNSCACAGTFTYFSHTMSPGASIATTPTVVTAVSHHSRRVFSGS